MILQPDHLFAMLFVYQAKHFVCDFPLQADAMIKKHSPKFREWVPALLEHCSVHGAATLLICAYFTADFGFSAELAIFDMATHFVMDRVKASPNLLGRFKALSGREYPSATYEQRASNRWFWNSLGFDQMVHAVVHLLIIRDVAVVMGWLM